MQDIFPSECIKVFRPHLAENGIVVSLPSIGKKYLPYFTRAMWHDLFPDKCYISCADPSLLKYKDTLNGAWFLDNEKGSWLKNLAAWLSLFIKSNVKNKKPSIIFAGSSMGGYASIYLANLVEGSFAFAECPQTNLYNYPGSNLAIEHILHDIDSRAEEHLNLICLFNKQKRIPNVHIFTPATDVHHFGNHVAPYVRAVGNYLKKQSNNAVYFKVTVEHSSQVPVGHAPISKTLFKEHIEHLFFESSKQTDSTTN